MNHAKRIFLAVCVIAASIHQAQAQTQPFVINPGETLIAIDGQPVRPVCQVVNGRRVCRPVRAIRQVAANAIAPRPIQAVAVVPDVAAPQSAPPQLAQTPFAEPAAASGRITVARAVRQAIRDSNDIRTIDKLRARVALAFPGVRNAVDDYVCTRAAKDAPALGLTKSSGDMGPATIDLDNLETLLALIVKYLPAILEIILPLFD